MKIGIIGTGYVGLTLGICLSHCGHQVICTDKDQEKIRSLINGNLPMHEPKLLEMLASNNVSFSTHIHEAVQKSEIIFITVGTPQSENGSCDLSHLKKVVEEIANSINGYKIIVIKSTVPPKTANSIKSSLKKLTKQPFDIISNPEFLRQGSAVYDFFHPDRIIIGSDNIEASKVIGKLYERITNNILYTDNTSAELIKYASNSFLATKISFINEIANLSEKIGATIKDVEIGMGLDQRIGKDFLSSGLGYGGSCFPKDIRALIQVGKESFCDMSIAEATDKTNTMQRQLFLNKIYSKFNSNLLGVTISIWGLSFKPDTDDIREAPSITIIKELLSKGVKIVAYDPKVKKSSHEVLNKIKLVQDKYNALVGADALLVLTEWDEFRAPDFSKIKVPIIFDGRRIYNKEEIRRLGIEYIS